MLLAESIRRYRQVTGDNRYDAVLEEIDGTYRQNFVRDGHFMTNIPERLDAADYPARRNGVCEDCGDYIVPLFCNENGRYVCEKCRLHEPLPPRPFGSLELSASQTVISKKWCVPSGKMEKCRQVCQTVKRSAMIMGFFSMLWPRQAIRWRRISAN